MAKYVQIWNSILLKKIVDGQVLVHGLRHSEYQWFLPRERVYSWNVLTGLYCIEQHSNNLRKITLQMISNALSDYEQRPGKAAL